MNALNFLDANVWMALIWDRHLHAGRAREWFRQTDQEEFLFCRFTQITVLRLLTTESVMGNDVRSLSQAWSFWDEICADMRVAFLPEPEPLGAEFRVRTRISTKPPKLWADAYLLAFAAVAGLKLVTFDHALASRGVEVLIL